jgi:lysophospholipase L1-like esterase
MVPRLPEKWTDDPAINLQIGGGPMILLVNGSKGGKDLSYYDDDVRRPKMITHRPDVIIIGDGHNDVLLSSVAFASAYRTFVRWLKAARPKVPIVVTTQNPEVAGTLTTTKGILSHAARQAEMAQLMSVEPGVTVLPTMQAYTDPATMIGADGVHPTDEGYEEQAEWMLDRLAPRAA